ncbi:MAG: sulfite exporter TauE/SafE family protein [Cyanobacteria bacterium P01_A01_bin.114]
MILLLVLGTVSCIAWFFSMLAGGGSPFILIPLVSSLLGAQAVAPVITTAMLVGNSQRCLFFRNQIDGRLTVWYVPGAIAGALVGAYSLTFIHLEYLQFFIGLGLLAMVLSYLVMPKDCSIEIKAWYFLPVAFLNAVGSGLIGSTGPVMNPLYLGYGLVKEPMIATKSLHKAVLHTVKLCAYLALGVLQTDYFLYGLFIGLAGIPANWLGKLVLAKISNDRFKSFVFGFVALSGCVMLWQQRGILALL